MAAFSRQVAEQIERLSLHVAGNSNLQQLEGMSEATVMAIKEVLIMMETATSLWVKGGVGAKVLGAEGLAVPGSKYDKVFWLRLQTAMNAYLMALQTPIKDLPNLAVVDENGQAVLVDGEQVRPFGELNVSVLGEILYSITDVLWIEPE